MDFDVDRFHDGYALTIYASPGRERWSGQALSQVELEAKLRECGVHLRDLIESISAADRNFERGVTDRKRAVVDIWRRAKLGEATPGDVEVIRRELRDGTWDGRRTYLINALHMSGSEDEALSLLLALLSTSSAEDDLELGLRLLSQWSPASYEHASIPFLRDVDDNHGVRAWAMTFAGSLIRRGEAVSLLDELIRIANDPRESSIARKDARVALVNAAGIDIWTDPTHDHVAIHGTDPEVADLIRLVREHLRSLASH